MFPGTLVQAENFALQIATKPLQIATWLLLTAYNTEYTLSTTLSIHVDILHVAAVWAERSITPYPTVPSLNPYDIHLAIVQNFTDDIWQTDKRTTECTNSLTVLSTVG